MQGEYAQLEVDLPGGAFIPSNPPGPGQLTPCQSIHWRPIPALTAGMSTGELVLRRDTKLTRTMGYVRPAEGRQSDVPRQRRLGRFAARRELRRSQYERHRIQQRGRLSEYASLPRFGLHRNGSEPDACSEQYPSVRRDADLDRRHELVDDRLYAAHVPVLCNRISATIRSSFRRTRACRPERTTASTAPRSEASACAPKSTGKRNLQSPPLPDRRPFIGAAVSFWTCASPCGRFVCGPELPARRIDCCPSATGTASAEKFPSGSKVLTHCATGLHCAHPGSHLKERRYLYA